MRPSDVLASVLLFSTACSAWPKGWGQIEQIYNDLAHVEKRQEKFDLSYTGVQGNTATSTDENNSEETGSDQTASITGDDAEATATETGDSTDTRRTTGSGPARQTGTRTGSGGNKNGTGTPAYDPRLPAGGVSMITPNALTSQYYKIKDHVTFAWNYTSLSATPSAIDVLATIAGKDKLYTIAENLTVSETQTLVWDTGEFQASATEPLLTDKYTLIIYDAAGDISQTPKAGYLGVNKQFVFGMYSPQPYTPIADYVCATCSGALSTFEKQTILALCGMACLTVLSFGWFTGVAGLW
ncbi:unnamed protein product [Zymoseptoria tritici ST99CH_1A5]|uniref:DUF7137 domain-containing protein n=1 Tax=Zymoseptoria tritici ST99CH_1A5 TaxID=1276529 RepID=A0A1Y6LBX6_ZYMTR|nr:unnamed protein product [Zymoseptoria tritici ST99CH_1A5]